MSWTSVSDGRWSFDVDEERHLLLQAGGRLVEFHGHTVHVYQPGPDEVDMESPLTSAAWVSTELRPDLLEADDAALWDALASPQYKAMSEEAA